MGVPCDEIQEMETLSVDNGDGEVENKARGCSLIVDIFFYSSY